MDGMDEMDEMEAVDESTHGEIVAKPRGDLC
jgi:hypothetical protein